MQFRPVFDHPARWCAALLAPALLLAACGKDEKSTRLTTPLPALVTVASVSTPERQVLSEIYAIGLEQAGYRVARLDGAADDAAGFKSVADGQASLLPQFSDELLELVRKQASNTEAIPPAVADQVAKITAELPATLKVTAVSTAEHKPSVACTVPTMDAHSLTNLSGLAAVADQVTVGIDVASAGTIDGDALNTAYDATFKVTPLADDNAARTAVNDKSVECLALDSSSPLLNELQLQVLIDDKAMVPGHAILPLISSSVAADVITAINGISARINTTNFGQLLNALASGTSPHVAARAFLDTTVAPAPTFDETALSTPIATTGDSTASTTGSSVEPSTSNSTTSSTSTP